MRVQVMYNDSMALTISVVIPAYNEENYIGKALESLQKQTVAPYEIIVADNNSTDKTAEIARNFGATVVREEKQGFTPARNRGFNEAQGDIIARIDADTIVPPNWIEIIYQNFTNHTIDGLTGPLTYYDAAFKTSFPSRVYLLIVRLLANTNILLGPAMVITKSIWLKIKNNSNPDTLVLEDVDLSLHIKNAGGKIGYDKNFIAYTSARRIKHDPTTFFIKYPRRMVRTFQMNKKAS